MRATPGWIEKTSTTDYKAIHPQGGKPIAEGDHWQEVAQNDPGNFQAGFNVDLNSPKNQ